MKMTRTKTKKDTNNKSDSNNKEDDDKEKSLMDIVRKWNKNDPFNCGTGA